MSEARFNESMPLEAQEMHSEQITLEPEIEGVDICRGADPFVFQENGMFYLLLQENIASDPLAHVGLEGYTLRKATHIENLPSAKPEVLKILPEENPLTQVWAAEQHGNYIYTTGSQHGDNSTHRTIVYEKNDNDEWKALGKLQAPEKDDSWNIDMTVAQIKVNGEIKEYTFWSGWEKPDDEFPQNIYIADKMSPTEIGERHLLAIPEGEWSTSIKPLLEGPQALVIDGVFRGLLVTGNASWTEKYETRVLKYLGGDPLDSSNWKMADQAFLPSDKGIGHGVVVQQGGEDGEEDSLFYIGHRKTSKTPGWEDRAVFYMKLDREYVEEYLAEITD